jgi:hypothetical protein
MTSTESVRFTKQASKFWNAIPAQARREILGNVYCVRCGGGVSIINASETMKQGDLVLEGKCSKCGHGVARLVEGPNA